MHLSKLKIKGFKSFADAVELDLSNGISAIVGPNGSGKSNITDAIRWVLGEQSIKTLRGKKMEDVIFAGTEQKEPLSYAEVTLIMDNSDGSLPNLPDEFHVMRRLFRTGESEYRLNNKDCKLKDIQQIFMDTGLGKNGYSLISQGAIEDIINSGPMELRQIVEEAVGIVSYKTRKIDAERKLERTRDNMDRVKDILTELEKRREPLKHQAQKAKEFLRIHEELKLVDLIRFIEGMDRVENESKAHNRQMLAVTVEINDLQQRLNARDRLYRQKQIRIQEMTQKIAEKIAAGKALEKNLNDHQRDLLVSEERLRYLEGSKQRITTEQDRIRESLTAAEKEQAQTTKDIEGVQNLLSDIQVEILDLIQKKDALCLQTEAFRLRMKEASEREETAAKKRSLIADAIQKEREWFSGAEVRANLASEEIVRLEKDQQERQRDSEKNRQLIVVLQEKLNAVRSLFKQHQAEKNKLEDILREQEQRRNVLKNNMRVNQRQRDYLKGIQENYSDYYPVIQKVMTSTVFHEADRRRIFGPVGELINVPESYTKAIEVALGGKTQYIVVENVAAANRCIDFLKNQKAGRATFLPLDHLRYSRVDSRDRSLLSHMKGFIGIASELIRFDDRFRSAVESLLSRTLVVQDFQTAENISRSIKKYTIVTLDGEIFHVGGAIVGGANKNGRQSPFFKKIEIDRLTAEFAEAEEEYRALTASCRDNVIKNAELDAAIQKESSEIINKEQQLWQQKQQQKTSDEQSTALQKRMTVLQASQEETAQHRQKHSDRLKELELSLSEMDSVLKKSPDEQSDDRLSEQQTALERTLTDCKIQEAQKKEQLRGMMTALEKLDSDLTAHRSSLKRMIQEEKDAEAESVQLIQKIHRLKKDLESQCMSKTETETEIRSLELDREVLNREISTISHDIQNGNHELMAQKDAQNKITLMLDRLETEKAHLTEDIYSRYEMNLLMAKDAVKAASILPEDHSENRQRALRRQINALGQVNLSAVEEYAEVEERYGFLKTQIDDLNEAECELKKIIRSLYLSMSRQFAEGFEKLQGIFSEVFTVLFEGGKARLSYTDPEHIMESGIELSAQPPGKKLKHISLLSGGETSMTAIALLFAFLKLNPSPFCVIDEIDAALDDGNIQRFTGYMLEMAKQTQFMLITHRKKTLEACNAIYGVTMSKTGISKLVSIRLSDYIEDNA